MCHKESLNKFPSIDIIQHMVSVNTAVVISNTNIPENPHLSKNQE